MSNSADKLTPAEPRDLADALAFALRFHGRKRVHQADEHMAAITAKRLVEHLERAGFVVMKRPPIVGGAALGGGSNASDPATTRKEGQPARPKSTRLLTFPISLVRAESVRKLP
jgi:hypothetical protein